MAEAIFRSGNPIMVAHTPGSAVTAGDVVVINGYPFIAHKDIAANARGELAAGGGVYDFLKDGSSGPDMAVGEGAAWIEADNLATDVLTGNVHLGVVVEAAGASAAAVRVYHNPNIASTNEST